MVKPEWVQAPAAAFVSESALGSQTGGCCRRNQDVWSWFDGSSEDLRASLQLLSSTWHLCHSRGGKRDSPGPPSGSAAALLQQNLILPALLRCLEPTCIVRVLQAYSSCRQLEVTQTFTFSAAQSNGNTSTDRKKPGRRHAASGETSQTLQKCAGEYQTIFHEIVPENWAYFCAKIKQTW